MHTCSRCEESTRYFKQKGTPRLVASVLHEDFRGQLETPDPKTIMSLVKGRLGLDCSYSTALRGKKQHVSDMRGNPEACYTMLFAYLHMLREMNSVTVTEMELDEEERFKYLFIALGASIEGFKAMRKVLVIDATFLKTVYGGMLVIATAQDPNRHHYPIAFGVIDSENHASWNWFFRMLRKVVPDEDGLVFISDRHQSIIKGVMDVFPNASHGHCIWHLSQNLRPKLTGDKDYGDFRRRYPRAAEYLDNSIGIEKWARSHAEGDKYNIDTSNSAESMNAVFREVRKYHQLPMIDAILEKFSEWFNKHRKDSANALNTTQVVPLTPPNRPRTKNDPGALRTTPIDGPTEFLEQIWYQGQSIRGETWGASYSNLEYKLRLLGVQAKEKIRLILIFINVYPYPSVWCFTQNILQLVAQLLMPQARLRHGLHDHSFHSLTDNLTLSEYYTKKITLWERLACTKNLMENGGCRCSRVLKILDDHETTRITQFLMGLNDDFANIRGHILNIKPRPSLSDMYNMLESDEFQRTRNVSRSTPFAFQIKAQVNAYQPKRSLKSRVSCTHCGLNGHSVDVCYKIHGYPLGWKPKSQRKNPTQKFYTPNASANLALTESVLEIEQTLSLEQLQHLVSYLNSKLQPQKTGTTASSSTATLTEIPSTSAVLGINPMACQVIDTGVTHHVTYDKSLSDTMTSIKQTTVKLANGVGVRIQLAYSAGQSYKAGLVCFKIVGLMDIFDISKKDFD
ncbi:MULE transposase domain [Arabidopsis suecica]|uniref:MULE transposase domain n=1 Tax=Arabidopsis suecica TaxID=45249 RepID=A0A8T2BPS2_ARASU|nr:MULE transposase domain [Arabidopsis suecica]